MRIPCATISNRRSNPSHMGDYRSDRLAVEPQATKEEPMLNDAEAFNGFAVDDLAQAQQFYTQALGLEVETFEEGVPLINLKLPGSGDTMIYEKADNQPANHTILNFRVDDLDSTVEELTARGIAFERYDDFDQDERGIAEGGGGPRIAWFKDPAGNILSVLEER